VVPAYFGSLSGASRHNDSCLWLQGRHASGHKANNNVLIVAASDKNDSSICERIVDRATSAVCSDNFIITSALNSRDAGACDSLKDKDRVAQCKKDVQAFAGSQKK
jgi:hypothetical protein